MSKFSCHVVCVHAKSVWAVVAFRLPRLLQLASGRSTGAVLVLTAPAGACCIVVRASAAAELVAAEDRDSAATYHGA
jgi:hypothetical protein